MKKAMLCLGLLLVLAGCTGPGAAEADSVTDREVKVYPDPITGYFESLRVPDGGADLTELEAGAWEDEVKGLYAELWENASPLVESRYGADLEKIEADFLRFAANQAAAEAYFRGTGTAEARAELLEWHAKSWYEIFSRPNYVPTVEYYRFDPKAMGEVLEERGISHTVEEYGVDPEWLSRPGGGDNPIDPWALALAEEDYSTARTFGKERNAWKAELLYTYDRLLALTPQEDGAGREALEEALDALLAFAPGFGTCAALCEVSEAFSPKSWKDDPEELHPGSIFGGSSIGWQREIYRTMTLRLRALLAWADGAEPDWSFDPSAETALAEAFRPAEGLDGVTVRVEYGGEDGPDVVTVTRGGEVAQTFEDAGGDGGYRPELIVEDMDFDGYLDFRYNSITAANGLSIYRCYRWSGETLQFERMGELDGLTDLSFDAETRTVRSYDRGTAFHRYYILRWTDEGLTYLRWCEFGREPWPEEKTWGYACRVWDHDPAAKPLDRGEDCWTEVAAWPPTVVEKDFEKAYGEFQRWLDPFYYGEDVEAPRTIPTDLLDLLTPLVDGEGSCWDFLDRYAVNGREEEAAEAVEEYVLTEDFEWPRGGWQYMADADNDGVDDVLFFNDRGTGHFTTLYFLKGRGDGTYENTLTVPFNRADRTWCVSWKGTRYLVSGAEGRDDASCRRWFSGLNLYLFEDGQARDRVFLSYDPECGSVTRYRWTQGENINFETADWSWGWAGNAYGDAAQ